MSDEKRLANELEEFLDDPERYEGALDQAAKQTANTLRKLGTSEQPRPGFVNELAQQLREKDREMSENPRTPLLQRLLRLSFSGVALAALLLVIVYATGLFRPPELEPAVQDMQTPETVEIIEPEQGPFAGHRLQFAAELPDGPGEVPRYQLSPIEVPDTVEDAVELGRSFGLQNPEVYEMITEPGRWVVRSESGPSVTFNVAAEPRGGMPGGIFYSGNQGREAQEGEPLPHDEAARIATKFLEAANLLPAEYEVQEQLSPGGTVTPVNIIPLVNGLPLQGQEAPIQVGVLPDGTVVHAMIHALAATPLEETVAVQPARQVLENLVQSGGGYRFSYENVTPEDQRLRIFYPELSPPQEGERVTEQGWVNVLVAVADGHFVALLQGRSQGIAYELSGPAVEELAEAGGGEVEVQGTIVNLQPNGTPVLEVESWQRAEPAAFPSSCITGEFAREDERALIRSDDGDTFDLGTVDSDLTGGERIEVCAVSFEEGQTLTWNHIVSPPSTEAAPTAGGGGASSGTVVEAVEVTRVITSGSSEGETESQVAEQIVPGDAETSSPYAIGDAIEVTGSVGGYLRREGEDVVPYLGLSIDHDDDPFTPPVYYPLYGNREMLMALSEYNRLYVDIQGTVVEATGEMRGLDGQAILVEAFEPSVESQEIQSFLGHLERETRDGREVFVLVERESGDRYVLNQDLRMMEDIEGAFWAAGVIHPSAEIGGLPVLEVVYSRSGGDVETAESAAEFQVEEAMQVVEEGPPSPPSRGAGLPETMIIERVELAYSYDNPTAMGGETLTPTWLFHGRSPDGLSTFVLRLDATQ